MVVPAVVAADTFVAPPAPVSEHTHPSVAPRHGGRRTVFALSFTAREATAMPVTDSTQTGYRYVVQVNRGDATQPSTCTAAITRDAGTATVGERVRVRLAGPRRWCAGHYRATVLLQREVVCTQTPGQPPKACPAIAFAPLDTGHTTFVVRP